MDLNVKSFALLINIYKKNLDLLSYFYPVLDLFSSYQSNSMLTSTATDIGTSKVGIFITLSRDASDSKDIFKDVIDKLKKRYPNIHIDVIENKGYDIGALLYSFKNIKSYEYVLRLHSKNKVKYLERIISILVSSKSQIVKALQIFSSNPKIALICSDVHFQPKMKSLRLRRNTYYLNQLAKQYKFKQQYTNTSFIIGTMFWVRTSFFAKLNKRLNFQTTYYHMNTINDLDWHWYYQQYKSIVDFDSDIKNKQSPESHEIIKSRVIQHWKTAPKSKFAPNYYKASQLNHSHVIRDGMLGNAYERFFSWAAYQLNYTVETISL